MATLLGTVSHLRGLSLSKSSLILKASDNKLILIAVANVSGNNYIRFKTSSDNGATWDTNWTDIFTTYGIYYFDAKIDGSDNVHITFIDTFYQYANYIKLTYSAGAWTPGASNQCGTDVLSSSITLALRSNGDIWVGALDGNNIRCYYSSNGTSWSTANINHGSTVTDVFIIEKGTYIWAIYEAGNALYQREYDSSWSSATTIAASGIANTTLDGLSGIRISDSNIWVACTTSSGIKVYHYTTSWDSGETLSNNASDISPCFANIAGKPCLVWKDYDGAQYDLSYRLYTGSSWASQEELISNATEEYRPNVNRFSSTSLHYSWLQTNGSTYDINFELLGLAFKQQTITSDLEVAGTRQTILSDLHIKATDVQNTILSDAYIVIEALYNINNKISFVTRVLSDIENKICSVIGVFNNINNSISTILNYFYNISNDIRTKKLIQNDVSNDIRFISLWQKPANAGFQSRGKEYIKVYISSIEQLDVEVDSIRISRNLNLPASANFSLRRGYDGVLPTLESFVEIKYNDYLLFSGYIVSTNQQEDTEEIEITCQDKYWLRNKEKVYFKVGHPVSGDLDTYYDTLNDALTAFSFDVNIGDFVPETLTFTNIGESDAISNLIDNTGNYAWFYDVNGNKKLWRALEGTEINLNLQKLGENLELYDVISHNIEKDASQIINKYRVQMGEAVSKNGSAEGQTTQIIKLSAYISEYLQPMWDRQYERLAKNSGTGYGFDYHKPSDNALYKNVFTRYLLPNLLTPPAPIINPGTVIPNVTQWEDATDPILYIYAPSQNIYPVPSDEFDGQKYILRNGFTIDFNQLQQSLFRNYYTIGQNEYMPNAVYLSEAYFRYWGTIDGGFSYIYAPILKLYGKKTYEYSITVGSQGTDPETDITNPLMFFTEKLGDYPETIIETLSLPNLSILKGSVVDNGTELVQNVISYDDSAYAMDYANWKLSKTCDVRYSGNINITLDAYCYYGIDLDKKLKGISDTILNIEGISIDFSNFIVTLNINNLRGFKRTISLPKREE